MPFLAPRKKFMCLISWERSQRRDPHKLLRGDYWVKKGAIFGHQKFSFFFFSFLPGVIRADVLGQKLRAGPRNLGKKQAFGCGHPSPEHADVHDPRGCKKTSLISRSLIQLLQKLVLCHGPPILHGWWVSCGQQIQADVLSEKSARP